jgi:hypothetical protein
LRTGDEKGMITNLFHNKYLGYLICSLFLCLVPATIFSWDLPPHEIQEAAKDGLPEFIRTLPENNLKAYGFSGKSETARTTLHDGIRVYTINPEVLFHYKKDMDVTRMIIPTDMWLFPVLSGGKTKSLLSVDRMHGKWKAVALGSSGLANQLEAIELKWPSTKGYELTFVRIFQAKSDFVFIVRGRRVMIAPLESGIIGLRLQNSSGRYGGDLYEPSEIMTRLIPLVRENIRTYE